jgi:hypothetical protein
VEGCLAKDRTLANFKRGMKWVWKNVRPRRARRNRPDTLDFVAHSKKTPFGIRAAQENIKREGVLDRTGSARRCHSDTRLRSAVGKGGAGKLGQDRTINNDVATYGQGSGFERFRPNQESRRHQGKKLIETPAGINRGFLSEWLPTETRIKDAFKA